MADLEDTLEEIRKARDHAHGIGILNSGEVERTALHMEAILDVALRMGYDLKGQMSRRHLKIENKNRSL
jgi:hypothetical protein